MFLTLNCGSKFGEQSRVTLAFDHSKSPKNISILMDCRIFTGNKKSPQQDGYVLQKNLMKDVNVEHILHK